MILLLSVRLLDDRYHGLTANGEKPEWPPSSFRLFQAIVAGTAKGDLIPRTVADALQWLETLEPPEIVVPNTQSGRVLLTFVLNNTECRSRTQKFIRPTLLNGDRLIEFAWRYDPANEKSQDHADTLIQAVRHIRAFGWGIDLAIGDGRIVERLPPTTDARLRYAPNQNPDSIGSDLRSPRPGSLSSLRECYAQYIGRFESNETTVLESGGPIYQLRPYTIDQPRPHTVFKLLDPNEDPARYPHAKLIHIAGMVRHLAIRAMGSKKLLEKLYPKHDQNRDPFFDGNPPSWIEKPDLWVETFIVGHRDGNDPHKQISYVPLPSIGHAHADGIIRNVMLVAPIGMERELADLARRIDGQSLKPEGEFEDCKSDSSPTDSYRAELRLFTPPANKFIAERYLGTSKVWYSVTPVILDGHNRKSKTDKPQAIARETEKLIRKALQRAGIETPCAFTWQSIPFIKNTLSAHKYDRDGRHSGYHRPSHLKNLTAVHVRLSFEYAVPGPITLGAGRHCGLGVFATQD